MGIKSLLTSAVFVGFGSFAAAQEAPPEDGNVHNAVEYVGCDNPEEIDTRALQDPTSDDCDAVDVRNALMDDGDAPEIIGPLAITQEP